MAKTPESKAPKLEINPPPIPSFSKAGRGKGWRADKHDPRDLSTKLLFGARRGLAPEASLEEFVSKPRDQTITSSCVGQAIARAANVRLLKTGVNKPYPSAMGIYDVGRMLGKPSGAQLVDEGSEPRLAMKGIKEYGVPLETAWPFDEGKINDPPPFDVLESASAFILDKFYRVDSTGVEKALDVAQALAAGYPVVLGVNVDQAFEDYSGKGVVTAPKGSLGGHMLCLVGYRTASDGSKQFRGVNSWGTSWGDGGLFWTDQSWLMDPDAGDIYVLTVNGG